MDLLNREIASFRLCVRAHARKINGWVAASVPRCPAPPAAAADPAPPVRSGPAFFVVCFLFFFACCFLFVC